MLYTREALRNHSQGEGITAIQRYFHKIGQGETRKLCPHECEYLAIRLRSIYKDEAATERVLEPYDQPFLSEAIFKYLILVYFENLDFLRPAFDGTGELSVENIQRDKLKFDVLLQEWRSRLQDKKTDPLLHEIKLEYLRKLEILKKQRANGLYGWFLFQRKCLEQELMAFYIYFTVKAFFKNLKSDHVALSINGNRFVINGYSYVHIVSRHYIAKFNGIDTERSFNNSLPFIDPFNLPVSLATVLMDYLQAAPANFSVEREYMIFSYRGEHYIVWWKKKKIAEIANEVGYEIRSLYKIQSESDRLKINSANVVERNADLHFYY